MANNQIQFPYLLGSPSTSTGIYAASTLALNTAASAGYLAFSFTCESSKTLTNVWVYMSVLTGTLAANDITAEIQTDASGGQPSGTDATGGGAVVCTTTPAVGWLQFTFTGVTIAAGTVYWLVLKNPATTSGSPTTAYPTYQWWNGVLAPGVTPPQASSGMTLPYTWGKKQSANSGSTWTTTGSTVVGWRIGYSDGSYQGFPLQSTTNLSGTKAFNNGSASIEAGIKFTSPANALLNLRTVSFCMQAVNAAGPVEVKLYIGSSTSTCTLAAVSEGIAYPGTNDLGVWVFHFTPAVVISPSTVCRLVIADTGSTGSTSKYFIITEYLFDTNCPAALLPLDGTLVKTTTTNGTTIVGNSPASAFTDSAIGTLMATGLALESNGEFTGTPIGQLAGARSIGTY